MARVLLHKFADVPADEQENPKQKCRENRDDDLNQSCVPHSVVVYGEEQERDEKVRIETASKIPADVFSNEEGERNK